MSPPMVGASALDALVVPCAHPLAGAAEAELDRAGFPLPLHARVEWGRQIGGSTSLAAIARDAEGRAVAMAGVSVTPTRALPWHVVLRVEAFSDAFASDAGAAILAGIARHAAQSARVLRAVIEVECRSADAKARVHAILTRLGYRAIAAEQVSQQTLAIDLRPSEEEVFSSFGRSTRQNIRSAAKHDLQVVALDDPACGPRMNALLAESLARTGAPAQVVNWEGVFALSRTHPHRSRVAGVFRGASRDPESLVGYAWGLHHGDRVEYHTGASARVPGVRLPILYPALWDLIAWGRRSGGTWFDLGGVSPGHLGSADALGGISDFKRGFSKDEITLGEEWVFVPRPFRARVAGWTSGIARRARAWARERRSPRATPEQTGHGIPATNPADDSPAT